MPSDNIGHAEQFNTTNKNDGSLWQKLTFFWEECLFSISKSKKHSDSNEIDFQWTVHWLIQTVKILEKNNEVSQFYAYLTVVQLFFFFY